MKKAILLLTGVLVLLGCDEKITTYGDVEVTDQIVLDSKKKDNLVISPGQYSAKLELKSNNKFELELSEGEWEDEEFVFEIPSNRRIPSSGEFYISAEESGQSYDIMGENFDEINESMPINGLQSCSYLTERYVYGSCTGHVRTSMVSDDRKRDRSERRGQTNREHRRPERRPESREQRRPENREHRRPDRPDRRPPDRPDRRPDRPDRRPEHKQPDRSRP